MTVQSIKKHREPWMLGSNFLEQIEKAENLSDFLRTHAGREFYQKYLLENPAQFGAAPIFKGQPTAGDVHVNQPLTAISIAFLPSLDTMVADKVFPNVPVTKQSDRYVTYPKGAWFRSDAQDRAPGTESAGSGYSIDSTPTYFCKPIALHKDIDDMLRGNADAMIDLDRNASEFVTRALVIKRERDWAAAYFTTSKWTGSTTGGDITPGTLWSAAGSTPIEDIQAQIDSVQAKTGYKPNRFVMGKSVASILKNHPEFLDRIKYTQQGVVTLELMAAVLGLEKVLEAEAIQNTAIEGAADALNYIADKQDALLVYAAPQPSLLVPSAGYTFSWTGYTGAGPSGQRVSRFRMEHLRSDRVEGEMAYDLKMIAPELGAFFNEAVA